MTSPHQMNVVQRCLRTDVSYPDPNRIVSPDNRLAWFRADQGITHVANRVSDWASIWGSVVLVQATGGSQPLLEASKAELGNQPAVANDNGRNMTATITNGFVQGARPYMWVMARVNTAEAASRFFVRYGRPVAANPALAVVQVSGGWSLTRHDGTADASVSNTGIARDTVGHLFEVGYTLGGFFAAVSGAEVNNTSVIAGITSATQDAEVQLFHAGTGSTLDSISSIAEIIISNVQPTRAQKVAMRAYFRNRYGLI